MFSENVCQKCGIVLKEGDAIKVSAEGFVCTTCLDDWLKGEEHVI
jgi:hypothetical protein